MLLTRLLFLVLIIFSFTNLSLSETAYCLLHNPTFTEILGTIQFIQPDPQSPTTIILEFSNLPPGIHGFHLNKACNLPPGHFDPAGPHHHGARTDQDRHAGDLGNIVVDSNGEIALTFNDSVITLFGANSIIGGGCVIHQGEDDLGLGGFSDSLINGHAGPGLTCGDIIEGDVVQAVRDDAEMQAMAKANHVAAVISIVSLVVQQAFNSGTLSVATTLMAANVLQYVRFIEIEYPKTLETLYKIQGLKPINLNFGPLFPQDLKVTAKQYVPLPRFARYQISSLMLVNYWTTIITTPILFLIAIFGVALGLLIRRNPFLRKGYNWFRDFLLWNFLIGFFLSNLDALILWSIVEYRSLRLDSGFARGSFTLNILLVLTGVALLVLFTVKICLINKKENNLPLEQQVERHKSIKVIFAEVKTRHLFQQLFLPIFAFRIILNNIILAAVDNSQVQCVLLLCATVVTMIYLVVMRPCRSLWKNFELFSYELLTLVVNTACVKLSFVSLDFDDAMVKQGKTIQNSTIAVNWIALFFTVIDAVILAYQFAVKKKLCKRKKQKTEKAKDPGQQAQPTEAKGINIEAIDELGHIPEELENNEDVQPEKMPLPYIDENNDDVPPEKVNVSDVQIELELCTIKSKQSSLTGLL